MDVPVHGIPQAAARRVFQGDASDTPFNYFEKLYGLGALIKDGNEEIENNVIIETICTA